MAFDGKKLVENLFFAVTCISCFTCIIRSDYNFATGFLCYYMIKNSQMSKLSNATKTVSKTNGFQIKHLLTRSCS